MRRLLVLGGTKFLGHQVVKAGLTRGWNVTTFNRGRSGADLPDVQAIRGDRYAKSDLDALGNAGPWDAVVDTSGFIPRNVLRVADALRPAASWYCFVSTVSVYAEWPRRPLSEASAVLDAPVDAGSDYGEDIEDGPTKYGYQKSGCEWAVRQVFGSSASIMRPGVLLGPGEYVGRLPWWLTKISRGGEVVAPGSPDRHIQPLDVRDAAEFICRSVDRQMSEDFNLAGPLQRDTFEVLINSCIEATGVAPVVNWIPDEVLLQYGVRQWSELPLWRIYDGTWQVDPSRALDAGLEPRALLKTVHDTWHWMQSGGLPDGARFQELGINDLKESRILRSIG